MTLLQEMLRLGPGQDWSKAIQQKHAGRTQADVRAELGPPARCLTSADNRPVDEYFVNNGFLDLSFELDGGTGGWVLAGCHLG